MKKTGKWGPVYQEVIRNTNLSVEAKAIYAYLSSIAGSDGSCYPSIETMQKELKVSKNRLTNRSAAPAGSYGFSRLLQKCHREGYNRKEK